MEILTPLTAVTWWKPYEFRKSYSNPSPCFLERFGALKTMGEILEKLEVIDFLEHTVGKPVCLGKLRPRYLPLLTVTPDRVLDFRNVGIAPYSTKKTGSLSGLGTVESLEYLHSIRHWLIVTKNLDFISLGNWKIFSNFS
ncbi:hypothetical protein WISP_142337 [Willisornis vidua]|uniref:Uncharacterized protein n=1 Tax=Willisornis vidua TaxID=1566151 RepID=A0ABQ9CLP1_9PASS|nr:hypothetical protein WISP_142337 [Willisornis vidua]